MPVNATVEYFVAEKKYLEARNKEEKIKALEEMIRALPKHKGSSHLLSELRHRLAKLKKETVKKASKKPSFAIKKEGAAQVCLIGETKSGKSTLLKSLTGKKVKIDNYPFTTKKPEVGMMFYGDVQIQIIEIPSTFHTEFMSLLHSCDLILILLDSTKNPEEDLNKIKQILEANRVDKKFLIVDNKSTVCKLGEICIDAKEGVGIEELKEQIWRNLNLIRVYTKSPGKKKQVPAIALKKGATVKDVASRIHKDFMKNFKFARIFNSSKFSGKTVGLDYALNDLDVVEIHTG